MAPPPRPGSGRNRCRWPCAETKRGRAGSPFRNLSRPPLASMGTSHYKPQFAIGGSARHASFSLLPILATRRAEKPGDRFSKAGRSCPRLQVRSPTEGTPVHSSLRRPGARGSGAAIIRFLPQGGANAGEADRRMGACIDGEGDLPAPGSKAPRGAGGFRFSALGVTRSGPWRSEGTGEPSGFAERCFRVASMAG